MDAQRSGVVVRLRDIRYEITNLMNETAGLRFETFEDVWLLRRAAERGIEIISEASRHIPDELKDGESAIPWRQIAGIGNVLRHDYENISNRIIWDIITNHLTPLDKAVERLVARIESEEQGPQEPQ
jgi:uncharacterized protein with HEPN domain